jgi:adenylate kinase family enzyme
LERAQSCGRVDDNSEIIAKLFVTFHEVSQPAFDLYHESRKSYLIDGKRGLEENFQ